MTEKIEVTDEIIQVVVEGGDTPTTVDVTSEATITIETLDRTQLSGIDGARSLGNNSPYSHADAGHLLFKGLKSGNSVVISSDANNVTISADVPDRISQLENDLHYINKDDLSASGDLTYNVNTGQFSVSTYKNFNADFANKSTSDLSEGTNLYFTTMRADDAITNKVNKEFIDGIGVDANTVNGKNANELQDYNNLTNVPTTFAPSAHTHSIAQVSGLETALSDKLSANGQAVDAAKLGGNDPAYFRAWVNLTGVPTTFAPDAHSHPIAQVVGLQSELDGKSSVGHNHAISDVTGLQAQLDAKADANAAIDNADKLDGEQGSYYLNWNNFTNIPTQFTPATHDHDERYYTKTESDAALADKAPMVHTHTIGEVSGLQSTLDGKLSVSATAVNAAKLANNAPDFYRTWANILGKPATFAPSAHTHTIGEVSGLQNSLDNKAGVNATWSINSVTGLQDVLDSKADANTISTDAEKLNGQTGTYYLDWTNFTSVPTHFTPSSHTHTISHVTNLQASLDGKSNVGHKHAIADVTGLQASLDSKLASNGEITMAQVTGLNGALASKADANTIWDIEDVANLGAELDVRATTSALEIGLEGKANTAHSHPIAQVTGLQTALDGKSGVGHKHAIADVTGLQTALNNKLNANTVITVDWDKVTGKPISFTPDAHSHPIAQVVGLQDALNEKLDVNGSISWSKVTGKPATFAPSAHNHDDRYYTKTQADSRYVNSAGDTMSGVLRFETDQFAAFGAGDAFQIFDNGSYTYVRTQRNSGQIRIDGKDSSGAFKRLADFQDTEVALYQNGSKRFETTSSGVHIHGAATISSGSNDALNFNNATTNQNRGIAFNGRNAMSSGGSADNWLRLNNSGEFSSGIYTPGIFRAQSGLHVADGKGIRNVTGSYGSVQTVGDSSSWAGYSINGEVVFMANSADFGIYDDLNNNWVVKADHAAGLNLYYNGSSKLNTTNSGVNIAGQLQINGHLDMNDNDYIRLGTGDDYHIYDNGAATYFRSYRHGGETYFTGEDSGGTMRNLIILQDNQYVRLYHGGNERFRTQNAGSRVIGHLDVDNQIRGNSVGGDMIATQPEAEAGTNNDQVMTPIRVKQSIIANAPTPAIASNIEMREGTNNTKMMTPLLTANAVKAHSEIVAWVSFHGGTMAISGQKNVSSVTRQNIGRYTINFANNLANTNYIMVSGATYATDATKGIISLDGGYNSDTIGKTTSSCKIITGPSTVQGSADFREIHVMFVI